jgi:hypothetical protein
MYRYYIVVLDPAVSGQATSISRESRTEVALADSCAILNRLSVNDKGVKKVAEGLRICDLSTFRR